jgi:glutathione S-transferase
MKLFHSPASPYVRKCLVAARELGLADRIEFLPAAAHPVNRDASIVAHNPLGKVPTLIADDGTVLFDSRVICEYLDATAGHRLFPPSGPARWNALVLQSLGDGIMDAAVLARYESNMRPEPLRWADWNAGQLAKVTSSLAEVERRAAGFGERVDIGTIAIACALGYLDLRFAPLGWRSGHPVATAWFARFAARESMTATQAPAS